MATFTSRGKPNQPRVQYKAPTRYIPSLNTKQKSSVKRIMSKVIEKDFVDTTIANAVDAAGVVGVLTYPPQGTAPSQRIGEQIFLKKLKIRLNVAISDATNIVRIIFFRWSPDNQVSSPTTSTVLQSLSTMAHINYINDQSGKVQVLLDRTWALTYTNQINVNLIANLYGKKLGKKRVDFNSTLVTGVDQIYYLLLSDSVAVTHPYVAGYVRMEYTDA